MRQIRVAGTASVTGRRAVRIRRIPGRRRVTSEWWLAGRAGYRQGVLHGRHQECAAVDRLLRAAREGRSEVLVLRGEAGVGKSALLAWAAGRAGEVAGGMTVLRAGGVESEVQLPFAALHQLLRPLLDRLGRLPAVQAAALRAALGLAGPPGGRDPSAERGGRAAGRPVSAVGGGAVAAGRRGR